VWLWKRTLETLKRALLVVNTLKGVVLRLCGEVPQRPLQIDESRIIETSVVEEAKKEMKTFRTGDLVRTTGNWEGWITLGVAYSYEDWLKISKQNDTVPNRRYIYVQAITGEILKQNDFNDSEFGGYYPQNVELLSTTE
jgi:hypothetical protein